MTRPQENTIERLALSEGRLYIGEGYVDRAVRVTGPTGAHWIVGEDGTPVQQLGDYSRIEW